MCASNKLCTLLDPTQPTCTEDGRCVCDEASCRDGFVCVNGACLCDSDEACVDLTGGYHSVCTDHQCGCTDAEGCQIVGPPMFETGNAKVDAAAPRKRFQDHPATTLVCAPPVQ